MSMNLAEVLQGELIKALGCTEPIAISYAAAAARDLLPADDPERLNARVIAHCSSNVIKNAKSVYVPMTHGLRGIEAAALIGYIAGDANKKLEVLTSANPEDMAKTRELIAQGVCTVKALETPHKLDILIELLTPSHRAAARVTDQHTNLTYLALDDEVFLDNVSEEAADAGVGELGVSLDDVYDYAMNCPLEDVRPLLESQMSINTAIAAEGLDADYGVRMGRTWLEVHGDGIEARAIAKAAAGSDARMSGCELPVVINSGSGNQGLTASVPVIEYAQELGVSEEKLYRALCLSNLLAIMQKRKIGRLSAYCGAVNAAAGAAAAIAYLQDLPREKSFQAMEFVLGTMSGLICDGAKASCAAKIAMSLQSAIMGVKLAQNNIGYLAGDGIIKASPDKTVDGVAELAKEGMRQTDDVIVEIMLDD